LKQIDWSFINEGYNCKVQLRHPAAFASPSGNLTLTVEDAQSYSNVQVFMQPLISPDGGHLGIDSSSKGNIDRNGKIFNSVVNGSFSVPSDWTIYLIYEVPGSKSGSLKLSYQFEQEDSSES